MAKENWICNVCISKGWIDVRNSLSKEQASPADMMVQCNKHAKPPGVMCDNCAEFYNPKNEHKKKASSNVTCAPSGPSMAAAIHKKMANNGETHQGLQPPKDRYRRSHPAANAQPSGPVQADNPPPYPAELLGPNGRFHLDAMVRAELKRQHQQPSHQHQQQPPPPPQQQLYVNPATGQNTSVFPPPPAGVANLNGSSAPIPPEAAQFQQHHQPGNNVGPAAQQPPHGSGVFSQHNQRSRSNRIFPQQSFSPYNQQHWANGPPPQHNSPYSPQPSFQLYNGWQQSPQQYTHHHFEHRRPDGSIYVVHVINEYGREVGRIIQEKSAPALANFNPPTHQRNQGNNQSYSHGYHQPAGQANTGLAQPAYLPQQPAYSPRPPTYSPQQHLETTSNQRRDFRPDEQQKMGQTHDRRVQNSMYPHPSSNDGHFSSMAAPPLANPTTTPAPLLTDSVASKRKASDADEHDVAPSKKFKREPES